MNVNKVGRYAAQKFCLFYDVTSTGMVWVDRESRNCPIEMSLWVLRTKTSASAKKVNFCAACRPTLYIFTFVLRNQYWLLQPVTNTFSSFAWSMFTRKRISNFTPMLRVHLFDQAVSTQVLRAPNNKNISTPIFYKIANWLTRSQLMHWTCGNSIGFFFNSRLQIEKNDSTHFHYRKIQDSKVTESQ